MKICIACETLSIAFHKVKRAFLELFCFFNFEKSLNLKGNNDVMEKPLECSSCTEKATVIYKTLYSRSCQAEILCKNCPLLTQKLVGKDHGLDISMTAEVLCNECGTPLCDVLKKESLGCEHCYKVFKDVICKRINIEKFDYKQDVMTTNKTTPSSEQLLKLSKDLQEAVDTENFEKAAVIRDEIIKLKKLIGES